MNHKLKTRVGTPYNLEDYGIFEDPFPIQQLYIFIKLQLKCREEEINFLRKGNIWAYGPGPNTSTRLRSNRGSNKPKK